MTEQELGKLPHTKVWQDRYWTRVIYKQVEIVKFNDEEITIRTDGNYTEGMAKRINQTADVFNLPFRVYRRRNTFWVAPRWAENEGFAFGEYFWNGFTFHLQMRHNGTEVVEITHNDGNSE